MDVSPVLAKGAPAIESYGPSGFRIAGQLYQGAVFLTTSTANSCPIANYAALTLADIKAFMVNSGQADVFLLGVGERCEALPDRAWREAARQSGVVLEAMSTAAACRTWNVLLAEGRRVCALLFLP